MFFFNLYNNFASKLMTNLRLQNIPLEIDSMLNKYIYFVPVQKRLSLILLVLFKFLCLTCCIAS